MIELSNHYLQVKVNPQGAELKSLYFLPSKKELLWQADAGIWARSAPILFPIVGKLKDNQFQHQRQQYSMAQHGFARDLKFETVEVTPVSCTMQLTESPETQSKYPWPFRLLLTHTLKGNSLSTKVKVENTGETDMPFSVGFHPGFNLFGPVSNYQIVFNKAETADLLQLENGLIAGVSQPQYLHRTQSLPLDAHIFDQDALVFEGLQSSITSLKKSDGSHWLNIHHEGFPFMGLWSKPGASFVCIEPWYGIADSVESQGNLFEKKGIKVLKPGQKFECAITIEVQHAL